MKKFNELCVKAHWARENAKKKIASYLKSEKGGVDQYITMILILIIVIVVGFLIYRYLGTGSNNKIFAWFEDNLGAVFGVNTDADATVP